VSLAVQSLFGFFALHALATLIAASVVGVLY